MVHLKTRTYTQVYTTLLAKVLCFSIFFRATGIQGKRERELVKIVVIHRILYQ